MNGVFRLIRHLRGEACGAVDQFQDARLVGPCQTGYPGCHQHQIRVFGDCLLGKHAEDAFVDLPLFSVHQAMAVFCHQPDSRRRVMSQQRVLQRLLQQALTCEPGAGPNVQQRDLARSIPFH